MSNSHVLEMEHNVPETLTRKRNSTISRHLENNNNEEEDEDYWEKKEVEQNKKRIARWDTLKQQDDQARMDHKKEMKIRILNLCLYIAVVFTAIVNFYMAFDDCFKTIGEHMRLEYLKKRGLHNCDAFSNNLSWVNDIVHVFHAFFSVGLLHATTKETAEVCVYWIFSQAAETSLFLFITIYNLRFHDLPSFDEIAFDIFYVVGMDIFGTIVILTRYYQLTNPYGERKTKLHVGAKKVLNFEIVFVHLPQFLQDKVSFREAANYETLVILQRLYGKSRTCKVEPNPTLVSYEVAQGLADLKAVEHYGGVKKLRQLKIRQGQHFSSSTRLNEKHSCFQTFYKLFSWEPKYQGIHPTA